MIARDAKPTSNTAPLPRIDLSARGAIKNEASPETVTSISDAKVRQLEADRIWSLVRQAAGGEVTPVELARLCAPL